MRALALRERADRPDPVVQAGDARRDLALEHDREQRRPDRGGDALDHVQRARRLRDLLARHRLVRDRHRRHDRAPEPDADHEQRGGEDGVRRPGPDLRECRRAGEADDDSHRDYEPRADAVGQPARERHRNRRADALRHEQHPCRKRALAANELVVQRQQDQRAEERDPEQEVRGSGRREAAAGEQRDVDECAAPAPPRMHGEEREERDAGCDPGNGRRVAEAAVRAGFGHPVDEHGQPRRQQRQAAQVESRRCIRPRLGQQPLRGDERGNAHRQVDEEDPAPARRADDRAADDRAEDRPEQHRHADDAHHAPHPLRPCSPGDDRLPDRHDQAAAEPLEDAEGDQRVDRPGDSRERGARHEQGQRRHPDALGAEPVARPAGERDHAREREQVARDHPLDRRDRGGEVASERRDRDVHDRRVEDRHDRAEDDDRPDDEDLSCQSRPVAST